MVSQGAQNGSAPEASQAARPIPKEALRALIFRLLLVCGILLGQHLIVSFFFDARALIEVKSLGFILGNLGYVAPVIVLAAAASIAFQGNKLNAALESVAGQFDAPRRAWAWLVFQLLLFGGFF